MTQVFENRIRELRSSASDSVIVAISKQVTKSEKDFIEDVNKASAFLSKAPSGKGILYSLCAYEFLVSLASFTVTGREVVIPGDLKRSTLEFLESKADYIVTSEPTQGVTSLPRVDLMGELDSAEQQPIQGINSINLCTSGSTGDFCVVEKLFGQLENELEVHENLWQEVTSESIICGSVSHQHIYGLLFRVLWPFITRRCFIAEQLVYPEDIDNAWSKHERVTFISSPALLKRISSLLPLDKFRNHTLTVFSSGGPLGDGPAKEVASSLGVPIELYGSTETGGVAYRRQTSGNRAWTTLPGVAVRMADETNRIEIKSPFLHSSDWYLGDDLIKIQSDGTFELLGRVDRIVKIEEKRVSLDLTERELEKSPFVNECSIVPKTLSGGRVILASAVGLSEVGISTLREKGRKSLVNSLKQILTEQCESLAVPRLWRFMEVLPRNNQGKLVKSEIESLFLERLDLPLVKSIEQSNSKLKVTCEVPSDLCYLEGHFPERPIVPGFVQFDWAMYFAREYLALPSQVKNCSAIKFSDVLEPGESCSLSLEYNLSKKKLHFEFAGDNRKYSSGSVDFHVI